MRGWWFTFCARADRPRARAVGSKTDGKRTDDFNAFKTLAEASQALSWVAWTPGGGAALPAAQCDEAWSSAEFWANKVLMQYRGKEEKQAAWVGAVKELFVGLKGYVRAHHPTGVAWNPKGGEVSDFKAPAAGAAPPAAPAAAPPRAGAPPPPPPPPPPGGPGSLVKDAPAPGATKAGAMSALFGDINKGEGVASGLRKVTDDMKAKNRADRTGAVPAADAKPGGGGGGGRGASAAPGGPPKFALEGDRKWVVENQVDAKSLVIEGCTFKQTVYVYNCRGCVITVKGKINSIAVDKCSRTGVVFGDVVAAVELVNSSSVEVQATGVVPTIAVDNCAGVQLYLASASLGCAITTAKSSEVNVLIPGASAEDDLVEAAIPEQFVTTYATGGKGGGKWVTEAVQHSAG